MNTNFFQSLEPITDKAELTLTVKSKEGIMSVLLMPKGALKPLTISGTPAELDAEFINIIKKPVETAAGIVTNLAEFEAGTKKAQSSADQAKNEVAKNKAEADQKRYKTFMDSAEIAVKAKEYKKAIDQLNQALPFTGQKDVVTKRIAEVKALSGIDGLFGGMVDEIEADQEEGEPGDE